MSMWFSRRKAERSPSAQTRRTLLSLEALEDRSVPAVTVTPFAAVVNASRSAGSQSETVVDINPTDVTNVSVSANDLGNLFTTGNNTVWSSNTSGSAFVATTPPNLAGHDSAGDPILVSFSNGRRLYVSMNSPAAGGIAIVSNLSTDGGITWGAASQIEPAGGSDKPSAGIGPDALNPGGERAFVTWHINNQIFVASSTDGVAWQNRTAVAPEGNSINSQVAVDSNGVAYIVWENFGNPGATDIRMSTSTDGGVTWSAARTILTTQVNAFVDPTSGGGSYLVPGQPDRGTWSALSLDVDRSGGANNNSVYVSFTDQSDQDADSTTNHNDLDTFLIASRDGGATFGPRVRVNDDLTANTQMFPWMRVDQTTGNVGVGWYDARNAGAANVLMEYFGAISDDGGATFGPNFQISAGQSNATVAQDLNNYGDYSGVDFKNGRFVAAWADNSNSTGDNPDGNAQFDLYYRAFDVDGGGGGLGNVVNVVDVSESMALLGGIDVNADGVVDALDDLNGSDGAGTLLDFALNEALKSGTSLANVIFGGDASALAANAAGDFIGDTSGSSANDGITDSEKIVRSIRIGAGGYFRKTTVTTSPTNYDQALSAILSTAAPGATVNMYSDGSGRLAAASVPLAALVAANIKVNVIVLGNYQLAAPTTDFTSIATATGGTIRRLSNLAGQPLDGGFPTVVANGGATRASGAARPSGAGIIAGSGSNIGTGSGSSTGAGAGSGTTTGSGTGSGTGTGAGTGGGTGGGTGAGPSAGSEIVDGSGAGTGDNGVTSGEPIGSGTGAGPLNVATAAGSRNKSAAKRSTGAAGGTVAAIDATALADADAAQGLDADVSLLAQV